MHGYVIVTCVYIVTLLLLTMSECMSSTFDMVESMSVLLKTCMSTHHQLGVGDMVLLKRTAFNKIQNHWEDTVYHVEGQPYASLPLFKISPAIEEGKVKIVHHNLLLPFGGNIEGNPENEGSQQDANGPQDCILAVPDGGVPGTEVVSTDPKPVGEGDAICVQCV